METLGTSYVAATGGALVTALGKYSVLRLKITNFIALKKFLVIVFRCFHSKTKSSTLTTVNVHVNCVVPRAELHGEEYAALGWPPRPLHRRGRCQLHQHPAHAQARAAAGNHHSLCMLFNYLFTFIGFVLLLRG